MSNDLSLMRASLCYFRTRTRPFFACSGRVLHHFVTYQRAGISPANAALRHSGATQAARSQGAHWPGAVPLLGAACLLAIAWTASAAVAARREKSLSS